MPRILLFSAIVLISSGLLSAQGQSSPSFFKPENHYIVTERSNWSKYMNGTYTGLTHRETRAIYREKERTEKGTLYSGTFFILEETLHDMLLAARPLDTVIESSFLMDGNGNVVETSHDAYPVYRNFPVIPQGNLKKGDYWEVEGSRVIDPKRDGSYTILPIVVAYTCAGQEQWKGEEVLRIKAQFATRYSTSRRNRNHDPDLLNASGTHEADILVSVTSRNIMLILERLDDTYTYRNGMTIRYRGSTAWFTEIPVTGAGIAVQRALDALHSPDSPGLPESSYPIDEGVSSFKSDTAIFSEQTANGIRLSIRDIKFMPDSDELLPTERARLDELADLLKQAGLSYFLVEGHTADTGRPQGEKELSLRRAVRMIDELVSRGLEARQFMYTGHGGTKPVGDNSTEEGRALNRRVEITILE